MYVKRQSVILAENNRPGHSEFDSMMAYPIKLHTPVVFSVTEL